MERRMKHILAIAWILVMVLVTVTACGSVSNNTGATSAAASTAASSAASTATAASAQAKDINITYATFIGEAEKDMMGICIKAFSEKNPNVKFDTQVYDHTTYQQKLPVMANSNTLPDLFWWNDSLLIDAYQNTKSVADVTSAYDSSFKSLLSSTALTNLTTKDGKVVGFPAEQQVQAWMYNKALFDKYGLQIPKTIDDLYNDVKVFKKNNVVTIAEGTKDAGMPTWGVEEFLTQWGLFDNAPKLFDTMEMKWSESPVIHAYEAVGKLAELGAFPANASTLNFEQSVTMFVSGNAAMISLPSDQLGKVVGTPIEKDCVYAWGPTFPDSPYDQSVQAGGCMNGYGVSDKAAADKDKLAAIVALNKFRFSEEGFKLSLKAGYNLPSSLSIDLSSFGKIVQDQAKLIADPNAKVNKWADYAYYEIWDLNWEAYGSKFGDPQKALFNALIDGSKKTADIPAEMKKLDAKIAEINKTWKANKK